MTETAIAKYDKPMTVPVQKVEAVRALLHTYQNSMATLMPVWCGTTTERVISTAIEAVMTNRQILRCTGGSILLSVKTACEFGLTFAKSFGQAYLVPYRDQCTLIVGYKGLMELVRRAADVKVLDSGVVYEGEVFEVIKGTQPSLNHVPNYSLPRADENIIAFYSIAFYENEHPHFEVMTKAEVDAIRARSKAATRGPWVTDYPPMGRKSVIRRHCNYLPISAEKARLLERAFDHDNRTAGLADQGEDIAPADRLAALKDRIGQVDNRAEPPIDTIPPEAAAAAEQARQDHKGD